MRLFRSGDRVQQSGIYRVHHKSHRLFHEATILQGARFPLCKECKDKVRFELARALKQAEFAHVIPFSTHVLLEEWPEDSTAAAG